MGFILTLRICVLVLVIVSFVHSIRLLNPNALISSGEHYSNTITSDVPVLAATSGDHGNETAPVPSVQTNEVQPVIIPVQNSSDPFGDLLEKYKGKFVRCYNPHYPYCEIFLCGTLHVSSFSCDMVKEVIERLSPNYVVLELCETRIDSLYVSEEPINITLSEVFRNSFREKSVKTFGMGLLSWMQLRAAKLTNSKLGGELYTAALTAHQTKSTIVLGDRLYGVTIQRIFDKLSWREKFMMAIVVVWEVLTMSLFKIKEYIHKTENDQEFMKDEMDRFAKHLPAVANVIIAERDGYIAQTLCEIARIGFGADPLGRFGTSVYHPAFRKGRIVAVVGAGHLQGIQNHIAAGGCSMDFISEISSSSKHPNTWPGDGILHVVNSNELFL